MFLRNAVNLSRYRIRNPDQGVIQFHVFTEFFYFSQVFRLAVAIADIHAYNFKTLIAICLLQGDKLRHFGPARTAPCAPHIQEDDLALSVGDVRDRAVEAFHIGIGYHRLERRIRARLFIGRGSISRRLCHRIICRCASVLISRASVTTRHARKRNAKQDKKGQIC